MLWIVSFMDLSFGVGLRIPLEDYSRYIGYGTGGEIGFRYFFTDMFGAGLTVGGNYYFQKRATDSVGYVWAKQTTQLIDFPVSLNLIMSFYLSEGMYLIVSLGGGGIYSMYSYSRRVGVYDSAQTSWSVSEKEDSYKVGGYLINFESAIRMTDFDVFTGVHIIQSTLKRTDMLNGEEKEDKGAFPVLYMGVRYFLKFGV
ncbi:MAG: hypothetical protein GXO39_04915 [Thermotogae bacterium]|nr:hypothetical protein [Thermotogota bacterium]